MEHSPEKTEQLHTEYIHDSKEDGYQDDYAGDISLPEQSRIIHRVDRRLVIITGLVRKILCSNSYSSTDTFRCTASLSWTVRIYQQQLLLG